VVPTVLTFVLILSLLGIGLIIYMIILGKTKNKLWNKFSKGLDLDFENVLKSLYVEKKLKELCSLVNSNHELEDFKKNQFSEWEYHELKIKRMIKIFWIWFASALILCSFLWCSLINDKCVALETCG